MPPLKSLKYFLRDWNTTRLLRLISLGQQIYISLAQGQNLLALGNRTWEFFPALTLAHIKNRLELTFAFHINYIGFCITLKSMFLNCFCLDLIPCLSINAMCCVCILHIKADDLQRPVVNIIVLYLTTGNSIQFKLNIY